MELSRSQLEQLYRDLERPLYNFALRWVFNSSVAEEIVQDAFVKIWQHRDSVDVATIKSYLYKTTQNLALNEIRRRKVRQFFNVASWFGEEEESSTADQEIMRGQNLEFLKQALEQLPLELREVLLLSEFSDLSYKEIAANLAIAEGTVASRKNRAIALLQKNFAEREKVPIEKGSSILSRVLEVEEV